MWSWPARKSLSSESAFSVGKKMIPWRVTAPAFQ
jgi:hypothetical protein